MINYKKKNMISRNWRFNWWLDVTPLISVELSKFVSAEDLSMSISCEPQSHWGNYNTNCYFLFLVVLFFFISLWSTQLSNPLKVNHFTEQYHMISKQMPKARKHFSTSISSHVSLSLIDAEEKLTWMLSKLKEPQCHRV